MATLVSPGVSVTITDASAASTAGPGTVPLVVFASASNKYQSGSNTAIATGTLASNNGTLWLLTSQTDLLNTFGDPIYFSVDGSQQYDNELNEHGVLALYQYLGIADTAYALRADIDLSQLIPTPDEPTGPIAEGTFWLDLTNTTWGIFQSNGNINSAYAWSAKTPTIISSTDNLQAVVQADASESVAGNITSASSPVFLSTYANYKLVINGFTVTLSSTDTLTTIVGKINNTTAITNYGITAKIFTRIGLYALESSLYGDIFNLRLASSFTDWIPDFTGSNPDVLDALGLTLDPTPVICPIDTLGLDGEYAIDAISIDPDNTNPSNRLWQKVTLTTTTTTTAWWFHVGSTDTDYPGWGWQESMPTVVTGIAPSPVFYAGQTCNISIGDNGPYTITIPGSSGNVTLSNVVNTINTVLSSVGPFDEGVNAVASIMKVGRLNYLVITNYDGTSIAFHDNTDETGLINGNAAPWATAGVTITQTYYGSVTGTVANPTFIAATLDTASANVTVAGTGYLVNDLLTVTGGTFSTASTLTVTAVQAATAVIDAAGTGYAVGDTLTFSGSNYTTPVILTVATVTSGAITSFTITQAGQYKGVTPPTTNVSPTSFVSTSGSGATVNFTWGAGTLTVANKGNYTVFPTNPATVTGGSGTGATVTLTSGFLTSNAFSINPATGAVVINVPASPNNTLAGVVSAINAAFPLGPIVANVTVVGADSYLTITNNNGTQFTLSDISGLPLNNSGIPVGYTYGRNFLYQGYTPNLTVPSGPANVATGSIWINTTPTDRGMNLILNEYVDGAWVTKNTNPNTGSIPVYSDNAVADTAFGASKVLGSIYAQYNVTDETPPLANLMFYIWDSTYDTAPIWEQLDYIPSVLAPTGPPAANTLWYDSTLQYEFMVSDGQIWQGYRVAFPATDPAGPILDASQPLVQSTGAPLVDSDIWVDTSVRNVFTAYRYDGTNSSWVLIDNTDHITPAGILFQDARASSDGTLNGPKTIQDMLLSNTVDPDCPNALFYPNRFILCNTRWSTNNIKEYYPNYFPARVINGVADKARWVTVSGNDTNGAPYIGAPAQRALIVESLAAAITDSTDAKAENHFFNIMACPGYVEVLENMVTMCTEKDYVFFILGDTPPGLPPDGTSISNWAENEADVAQDGPLGLTTAFDYAGLWYPWVLTTNTDGSAVFAPPSTAMLQVIAYNDNVAYPWFAPAGFNRGLLTNADSVGYLLDGEYKPLVLNQGQRDVMYQNNINPIGYFPNKGLAVWGQKTLASLSTSALSRVNVARLVNYLSYNLNIIALPFLFEQNDAQTRASVVTVFNSFMGTLITTRAIYDYSVVCDLSNNLPATIDENELYIDVAIQPERAIEFIYIPIRIYSTGATLPAGSSTTF